MSLACSVNCPNRGMATLSYPYWRRIGVVVDPGTLHPLLRRLEKQGMLESRWDSNESRPRKYYLHSPFMKEVYAGLHQEWRKLVANIEGILTDLGGGE